MGLSPLKAKDALLLNAKDALLHIVGGMKCQPVGRKVKQGTEYIDHSILGDEADMRLHMKNLREYLKENPGDIETRISLANLEEIFGKN